MSHLTESQRRKVITLRKPATEKQYAKRRQEMKELHTEGCAICRIPTIEGFPLMQYWRVVRNEFPYDKIAERSYMFMPKRCIALWSDLTSEEVSEWNWFRQEMGKYGINFSMWSSPVTQSVPMHYHEHLIRLYTVKE